MVDVLCVPKSTIVHLLEECKIKKPNCHFVNIMQEHNNNISFVGVCHYVATDCIAFLLLQRLSLMLMKLMWPKLSTVLSSQLVKSVHRHSLLNKAEVRGGNVNYFRQIPTPLLMST